MLLLGVVTADPPDGVLLLFVVGTVDDAVPDDWGLLLVVGAVPIVDVELPLVGVGTVGLEGTSEGVLDLMVVPELDGELGGAVVLTLVPLDGTGVEGVVVFGPVPLDGTEGVGVKTLELVTAKDDTGEVLFGEETGVPELTEDMDIEVGNGTVTELVRLPLVAGEVLDTGVLLFSDVETPEIDEDTMSVVDFPVDTVLEGVLLDFGTVPLEYAVEGTILPVETCELFGAEDEMLSLVENWELCGTEEEA